MSQPLATAPVSHEKRPSPATFSRFYQPLTDGCFRDGRIRMADDGSFYVNEWTPTLNRRGKGQPECLELIAQCALAGGGFIPPSAEDLLTLVNRSVTAPATYPELRQDTHSDWYWTVDSYASSSDCAWYVDFSDGFVSWNGTDYDGFARGVRRVAVASPSQ